MELGWRKLLGNKSWRTQKREIEVIQATKFLEKVLSNMRTKNWRNGVAQKFHVISGYKQSALEDIP